MKQEHLLWEIDLEQLAKDVSRLTGHTVLEARVRERYSDRHWIFSFMYRDEYGRYGNLFRDVSPRPEDFLGFVRFLPGHNNRGEWISSQHPFNDRDRRN